jgi:Holliday junction DNA helicase RuvB
MLRCELAGATARKEPMPHIILTGTSGVGKTRLARALANERGTRLTPIMGTASREELISALLSLEEADFLLIDEAHALAAGEQELLFLAMDDLCVPALKQKSSDSSNESPASQRIARFTLVIATDRPSKLLNAFKKRFPTTLRIRRYCLAEMRDIVACVAAETGIVLTTHAVSILAGACHGLPRRAEQLLRKLPYYVRSDEKQITKEEVRRFLRVNGIDRLGLGPLERKYLRYIGKFGRPKSVTTLARVLDCELSEVIWDIETSLVRKGMVDITSAGRVLTARGKKWCDARKRQTRAHPRSQIGVA